LNSLFFAKKNFSVCAADGWPWLPAACACGRAEGRQMGGMPWQPSGIMQILNAR
jgi:hypothetical protein